MFSDFHDGSSTGGHARWETKQSTSFYPGKFHHSSIFQKQNMLQMEILFISILQSLQWIIVQSSISNRTLHYHGFSTWFHFEHSFFVSMKPASIDLKAPVQIIFNSKMLFTGIRLGCGRYAGNKSIQNIWSLWHRDLWSILWCGGL